LFEHIHFVVHLYWPSYSHSYKLNNFLALMRVRYQMNYANPIHIFHAHLVTYFIVNSANFIFMSLKWQ